MCGIIGVLNRLSGQKISLAPALQMLHHRGPDDQGIWSDPYIQLGHARLSILDLSSLGHQPMSYRNNQFWLSYNGEIYNYVELRQELLGLGYRFDSQTDTEVLAASYAQWGSACLQRLRGMFAFSIWDTQEQRLFLARDRVGEKPLFYWSDHDTLYFASELKALLAVLPCRPELNVTAIEQYLYYQYVPEPLTPLAGIVKLPPAHYMLVQRDTWKIMPQRYWSLEEVEPVEGDPGSLIREELYKVIELTLRSDVPVGVSLSGGIDSGGIASLAVQKYQETLQAFSLGYEGVPPYDEREQARNLAHTLQIPFWDIEINPTHVVEDFGELVHALDEPIADIAAYGYYRVMKKAAERGIKVMLNGFGGDELFWGYQWVIQSVQLTRQKFRVLHNHKLPPWLWKGIAYIINNTPYQWLASLNALPACVRFLLQKGAGFRSLELEHPHQAIFYELTPGFQEAGRYAHIFTTEARSRISERAPQRLFDMFCKSEGAIPVQICQFLFDTWLTSNCIALGDRLSMAASIEARLPLVDYKLIELVIGLRKFQPDYELGYKSWLKSALHGSIPDSVLSRPKQGFQPPVQLWMEAIVNQYIHILLSGHLYQKHIFSGNVLQTMVQEFQQTRRHTFMLYKLLLLETWYCQVVMRETI